MLTQAAAERSHNSLGQATANAGPNNTREQDMTTTTQTTALETATAAAITAGRRNANARSRANQILCTSLMVSALGWASGSRAPIPQARPHWLSTTRWAERARVLIPQGRPHNIAGIHLTS